MLKPTTLHLRNFCKFADFSMTIDTGTTAVIGPNGSGKSTVFAGLVYALTGWCDPSWGSQQELQKDGEALPGYAEMEFNADGTLYRVQRFTLTGGKNTDCLYQGTELLANRRQKVNEYIEQFAGMPCTLLAQLMWCRQEALKWLLVSPPNVINPILAQLFDCSRLEKLRDVLKKATDTIASLRSDFEERQTKFTSLLDTIPTQEALEEDIRNLTVLYDTAKAKLDTCDSEGIDKKSKQNKLEELNKQKEVLTERYNSLITPYPEPVDKPSMTRDEINKIIEENRANIKDAEDNIHKINYAVKYFQDIINKLNNIRIPNTCSLCGSVLTNKKDYEKNLVSSITEKAYTSKNAALKKYNTDIEALNSTVRVRAEELKTDSEENINNAMLELGFNDAFDEWTRKEANRKLQLDIVTEKLNNINLQISQTEALKEIPENIQELKEEFETHSQNLENAKKALIEATAERAAYTTEINTAKADEKAYKRNEAARVIFQDLRACFSQTRAQAVFLKYKIKQLNDQIAEYISMTDMPFSLWLDEDEHIFKYKMLEPEALVHSASKLSGAQKAISSLIIQLSLINLCQMQCKLRLFDEVDAALSTENKLAIVRLQESLVADKECSSIFISQSSDVIDACHSCISI